MLAIENMDRPRQRRVSRHASRRASPGSLRDPNEENIPPSSARNEESEDDNERSQTSAPIDLSDLETRLPSPGGPGPLIQDFLRAPIAAAMNKDSQYTYVHMHASMNVELLEEMCKEKLPDDDIFVPAHLQPINPEDEDDVVPDQHAAFGIQKATQKTKEPVWKDLGLAALMTIGPGSSSSRAAGGARRKKRVQGAASEASGGRRALPR